MCCCGGITRHWPISEEIEVGSLSSASKTWVSRVQRSSGALCNVLCKARHAPASHTRSNARVGTARPSGARPPLRRRRLARRSVVAARVPRRDGRRLNLHRLPGLLRRQPLPPLRDATTSLDIHVCRRFAVQNVVVGANVPREISIEISSASFEFLL